MWKIVRSKLRPTRLFHSKIVDASNALDSFFVSQLYIGQCHIYVVIVARVCGAIGIINLSFAHLHGVTLPTSCCKCSYLVTQILRFF